MLPPTRGTDGTQHIFEAEPLYLFISLHFFPSSGAVEEVGRGPAAGRTVNVPWQ